MRLASLLAAMMSISEGPARAQAPAAAPAAVAASTKTVEPTVDDLYRPAKIRDPFADGGGGGGKRSSSSSGAARDESGEPEPFDIHSLTLTGIMADKGGDFAVMNSPAGTFVLKKGKIYDSKGKPVPNVTGVVKAKQKTVHVMTVDNKDVQTLVLGEDEEGL